MGAKTKTTKETGTATATQIVMMPVGDLMVSPKNPRKVYEDEFEDLKASIQKDPDFLKLRPILVQLVNKRHIIYGGTQRYRACVELGMAEVPCIVSEKLSHSEVDFRMLADNAHAGSWDESILFTQFTEEMQDIVLSAEDMSKIDLEPKKSKNERATIPMYKLMFATKDDQNNFYALLQYLAHKYPEMTVGERVFEFLSQFDTETIKN